jgi:hypothetical protein
MEPDGTITRAIMPDFLHLSPNGYAILAKAVNAAFETIVEERREAAKEEFPMLCEVHLHALVKRPVPIRYGLSVSLPMNWNDYARAHYPHAVDFVAGGCVVDPQSSRTELVPLCAHCFKAAGLKMPEPAPTPPSK